MRETSFHLATPLTVLGEREGAGERGRKGGSALADYLSTSVINVETRILPGLCVRMCACVCLNAS